MNENIMNQMSDEDFLLNYIQKNTKEITVKSLGNRKFKIKKLSSAQSKMAQEIIKKEFGTDELGNFKLYKYLPKLQSLKDNKNTDELKLIEEMGDDYEDLTRALLESAKYKISCSTGIKSEIIEQLDDEILMDFSYCIDTAFLIDTDEDLKKK